MRTTKQNPTEKITKKYEFSVQNFEPTSPTIVVLNLTSFQRKGGET
jgi:hypothetical protein